MVPNSRLWGAKPCPIDIQSREKNVLALQTAVRRSPDTICLTELLSSAPLLYKFWRGHCYVLFIYLPLLAE